MPHERKKNNEKTHLYQTEKRKKKSAISIMRGQCRQAYNNAIKTAYFGKQVVSPRTKDKQRCFKQFCCSEGCNSILKCLWLYIKKKEKKATNRKLG